MIYSVIMNDNLSPDLRIAELKAKGMKNKDIAPLVYPDLPIESALVKVSRHLTKGQAGAYLEQSKLQALKEHNITWSRIIAPIADALEANHVVILGSKEDAFADVQPDHSTRLRASRQASELLKVKDEIGPDTPAPINLPSGMDEVQILRAWKNPPPKG